MGDGTKENPYTREDVLRLIKENGGKAEGLILSKKWFEKGIDLSNCNLDKINIRESFLEEAIFTKAKCNYARLVDNNLTRSHFENAELTNTVLNSSHLEDGVLINVNLDRAHLNNSWLHGAHLEHSNLENANFEAAQLNGTFLYDIKFNDSTNIKNVNWGNFIIGEESRRSFVSARDTYRRLKIWYTEHGIYDVAGRFFYREMEVKRKIHNWKERPFSRLWYLIMRILCGYGEKPERVVISAAAILLVAGLLYFLIGAVWQWEAFWRSLYFSTVSFTALGYGNWVNISSDWIRGLGAAESFLGVFMMALFLVTFTRKMTR